MNSFRGRISRSKIVRLEKVLVRLSEFLTEKINNLIDEEQFHSRRLWVRKWIRRRGYKFDGVSLGPPHCILYFKIHKKNHKCYCKNSPRVCYHTVDTVLHVHSVVVERLVLRNICLVGSGGRLVGK